MEKLKLYWSAVATCILGFASLCASLYFSLTNTAYVIMGCPAEMYPELGFLLFGIPASLLAIGTSISALQTSPVAQPKAYWLKIAVSAAGVALCISLVAAVFYPPATTACRSQAS